MLALLITNKEGITFEVPGVAFANGQIFSTAWQHIRKNGKKRQAPW